MLLQFKNWLASGEKTPHDLLALCLSRIAEFDPEVRAWVEVAPQHALGDGPLRGIPFGAKDIFETRGMATEYGSRLYAGRKGDHDAHAIADLRRAGAVLLGKTHTTAFASFDPAPTRNPKFVGHTPGGSSSGSAAAVAAGMVPFAVGTQTLGSVLRPASYCGICGFKPTYGLISMDGALPFAPSLDTAGFFTASAGDMACLWKMCGRRPSSSPAGSSASPRPIRAAHLRVAALHPMSQAVQDAARHLHAVDLDAPPGWDRLQHAARLINDYEGAHSHRARYHEFGERIGTKLAELIRHGLRISDEEYKAAIEHVERMKSNMAALFCEYPYLLTPAATGPAPFGLDSTGDPVNNAPWTALSVPAISVPMPVAGGPLGLQIAAAWHCDEALVAAAAQIEGLLSEAAAGSHRLADPL